MIKSKFGQMWYIDFMTAIIIFILGFLAFIFFVNNNFSNEDKRTNEITYISEQVSDVLFSEYSGDSLNLLRYGKISESNILQLFRTNYNSLKNKFGLVSDFMIFFRYVNSTLDSFPVGSRDLEIIGFNGSCGVNIIGAYNISNVIALLYDGNSDTLTKFSTFGYNQVTDIYDISTINSLMTNINKYSTVIMYDVDFSILNSSHIKTFEEFVYSGNNVIMGGDIIGNIFELSFDERKYGVFNSVKSQNFEEILNGLFLFNFPDNLTIYNFSEVSIENIFLSEKMKDSNYELYHYLVNSNVSEIYFLSSVFSDMNTYPTIIFERYGFGEIYFLFDFFGSVYIDDLFDKLLSTKDIHFCKLNEQQIYLDNMKKIIHLERRGRIGNDLVIMDVISYEK